MTTVSDLLPPSAGTSVAQRPRHIGRFAGAFVLSAFTTLGLTGAAVLAYDANLDGRILPGVRIGSVDLSGMDRQQAAIALESGYSAYGDGRVLIRTDAGDVSIAYREFSRRPDVEAMIDAAMGAGRDGSPLERAFAEPSLALRGLELGPRVTFDEAALTSSVVGALARLEREPIDATIAIDAGGIMTTPARIGRGFDASTAHAAAFAAVRLPDAPSEVVVYAPATALPPTRGDAVVLAASAAAERVIVDLVVTHGAKTWTIPAATVQRWVRFDYSDDGSIATRIDDAAIPAALEIVAKAVVQKPVSASFLIGKDGAKVGVTAARDGQRLDATGTATAIARALASRAQGAPPVPVPAALVAVAPKMTTEEAEKVAPLMVRLSSWKTWFPIGERNHWGANIWLPARFINGTVLAPGQTFEWFRAVGPITTARGFGLGGVIRGNHTEPMGAIGGGMCSSSTTLFNAALRAGLDMGARTNHSYYINRYPLGLDATINGGSATTMTFTNDMDHPILIRGYKIVGSGGRGWVRYEIWGVPEGRTVSIGKAVVSNMRKATTETKRVTTLPTGVRKQTEYASNGMDVSVTRIVRDRDGHVIHRETFHSHYKLWTGLILVGI